MSLICSIPILGGLLAGCGPALPLATGYVEGEYVLVAPVDIARIEAVSVRRGDRFTTGQALVAMERKDVEMAVAQAVAALAQAESQLADLRIGKRPEEIAMVEAALNSARAERAEAERKAKRAGDLARRGIAAQADLETASTAVELAAAKVAELEANLAVARLPARTDQIAAAEAAVKQFDAALETAQWRLANRTLTAPATGSVSDILREAGEVAGPQAPVLTVLPDGAVKLKLYIAEKSLAGIAVGTRLKVNCDGCGAGLTATVSYVASDPEFTPPVIYSLENRQKLVYLIEARPDADAAALKPGQIVDAELGGAQDR